MGGDCTYLAKRSCETSERTVDEGGAGDAGGGAGTAILAVRVGAGSGKHHHHAHYSEWPCRRLGRRPVPCGCVGRPFDHA